MNIIKVSTHEEMSKVAAGIIKDQITNKPNSVLGLATGNSPVQTYENLVKMYKSGEVDFSRITSFNLDEYCGLPRENDRSYHYFMMKNLFSYVNIDPKNINIPNGLAEDVEKECADYDAKITAAGGIDLQLLGIGNNGHIGFNEPSDSLVFGTHEEELTQSTIDANSRFFDNADDVPKRAVTMGLGSIMMAKKILLIAGAGKEEIINKTLYGPITTTVPASLIQLHRDATVVYVGG